MAIITCPSCSTKNRVGPIESGTPRCAGCKTPLPWIVDAGEASFGAEINASVPVIVDFWAEWCGPALPKRALEERLAGVIEAD